MPLSKREREQLTRSELMSAKGAVTRKLAARMHEKGFGTLASMHEILGIVTEEYAELVEAVHDKMHTSVEAELVDIAVACLVGLASIRSGKVDW